jgi:hypothetical protein
MVYITEAARRYLRTLCATMQRARPSTLPRIAARAPGQLGVFRGVRTAQDTVIYHQGSPLLLLGPVIAATLDRTVIHCSHHGRRTPQLVVTRLPATPEESVEARSSATE